MPCDHSCCSRDPAWSACAQLVEQHSDVESVLDNSVASRAHVQAVRNGMRGGAWYESRFPLATDRQRGVFFHVLGARWRARRSPSLPSSSPCSGSSRGGSGRRRRWWLWQLNHPHQVNNGALSCGPFGPRARCLAPICLSNRAIQGSIVCMCQRPCIQQAMWQCHARAYNHFPPLQGSRELRQVVDRPNIMRDALVVLLLALTGTLWFMDWWYGMRA